MPALNLPNAKINYEVWGNPTYGTITLLNGHTRPLTDFRILGRKLVDLGFQVLALDNRGAGETESASGFTLTDMAEDVQALWNHIGITKTQLLGISMGGFIALTLARLSPERVSKLFLVSTASHDAKIVSDGRSWNGGEAEVWAKLSRYFSPAYAQKNHLVLQSMARQISKGVEEGKFLQGSQGQREALKGFDARGFLPSLQIPTHIIHGSEDVITPLACATELHGLIPQSELSVLEGAGHLLLAERPQEFFRVLSAALSGGIA